MVQFVWIVENISITVLVQINLKKNKSIDLSTGSAQRLFRKLEKEELILHFNKNKQKEQQSMKNKGVSFRILGKEHHLKAIFEDLKELGYVNTRDNGKFISYLEPQRSVQVLCTNAKTITSLKELTDLFVGYEPKITNDKNITFNLPKDYQAALDHCSAQLELFKSKDIVINGYTAEVKDGNIKFGCKEITKEQLLAIKEVSKLSNQLGSLTIINGIIKGQGPEFTDLITLETIDLLLEKLK